MNRELVAEYFEHNDGKLFWKKAPFFNKKYLIKQEAGTVNPTTGYRQVKWMQKIYKVHRLIFLLEHNYLPKEIDHINGNRQDNRLINLREATRSQNEWNKPVGINNSSGYKGVSWSKSTNSWMVRVEKNKCKLYYGCFNDLDLAGLVASEARIIYHGVYAK
jgi:hypothetical protein